MTHDAPRELTWRRAERRANRQDPVAVRSRASRGWRAGRQRPPRVPAGRSQPRAALELAAARSTGPSRLRATATPQGYRGVERLCRTTDVRGQPHRIAGRSNKQVPAAKRTKAPRDVDGARRRRVEALVLHVANHADDRRDSPSSQRRRAAAKWFAHRIAGGEVKTRGRFAQDDHRRSRSFVSVTEIPAGHELRAEGSKIAGRSGVDLA